MQFKELYYYSSKRWDFSIDPTRWVFGIEWYKKLGWVEISIPVFTVTIWWKKNN
jgi:hypothetical protein